MKRIYKVIFAFLIILILSTMLYQIYAKDIWGIAQSFIKDGSKKTGMTQETTKVLSALGVNTKGKFEELIDFLWGIGLLVIFISTVVLGIKYMLVLPAEKSRLKQATTPYIIGVVIIFGALTIWKFIIVVLDGSLT